MSGQAIFLLVMAAVLVIGAIVTRLPDKKNKEPNQEPNKEPNQEPNKE